MQFVGQNNFLNVVACSHFNLLLDSLEIVRLNNPKFFIQIFVSIVQHNHLWYFTVNRLKTIFIKIYSIYFIFKPFFSRLILRIFCLVYIIFTLLIFKIVFKFTVIIYQYIQPYKRSLFFKHILCGFNFTQTWLYISSTVVYNHVIRLV